MFTCVALARLQGKPWVQCFICSAVLSGIEAARALGRPIGEFQNELFVEDGRALDDEALIAKGRRSFGCTGPAVLTALFQNACGSCNRLKGFCSPCCCPCYLI